MERVVFDVPPFFGGGRGEVSSPGVPTPLLRRFFATGRPGSVVDGGGRLTRNARVASGGRAVNDPMIQVVGERRALPWIARGWLEGLEAAPERSGGDRRSFLFAADAAAALAADLDGVGEELWVHPGPTSSLEPDHVTALWVRHPRVVILCDALPDEVPEAWARRAWPRPAGRFVFPPVLPRRSAPPGGGLLVVEDAGEPLYERGPRGIEAVDWAGLAPVLAAATGLPVRVAPAALGDEALADAVEGHGVVLVASRNAAVAGRVARFAWRVGATPIAAAGVLGPCLVFLQESFGLVAGAVPAEWTGLRTGLAEVLAHLRRRGPGDVEPAAWVAACASAPEPGREACAVGAVQRALAARMFEGGAGWGAGIALCRAQDGRLRPQHWETLARCGEAAGAFEPGAVKAFIDGRVEVAQTLATLAAHRTEVAAAVGRGLFLGACDGTLLGWRREVAGIADAVFTRAGAALDARGRAGAAAVALALGRVESARRAWAAGGFDDHRLVVLWEVLRAWAPAIEERGSGVPTAEALDVWRSWFAEVRATAGASARLVEALAGLYFQHAGAPAGAEAAHALRDSLPTGEASAFALSAWLLGDDEAAARQWRRVRGGPVPEGPGGLFPFGVGRALWDRDRSALALFAKVGADDPSYFTPVTPANTRAFFRGVAHAALGDADGAAHWRRLALANDPAAAARDRRLGRSTGGPAGG